MTRTWRMSVYDLALGDRSVTLPGPAFRFVYVISGSIGGRSEAGMQVAESGSGFLTRGSVELEGPAEAWIYDADPSAAAPLAIAGLSLVLSSPFTLQRDEGQLIRADRVEAPAGAVTPRHGHRGPGIRRLLRGRILAELGDHYQRIEAGQAWFETGHDPIVGTNITTGTNAFVRVMVLPAELAGGKSSFVPTTPDDATQQHNVTRTLFGELIV